MRHTIPLPPAVVATIAVVAATVGGAFTATAGATTPVEHTAATTFCLQVNAERAARSLTKLRCTYDGSAQAAVATHTDSTAVWIADVPNSAAATIAFMQSADHRWWLMDPTATTIDIGVSCVDYRSSDGWTGHVMDVGANLPDAHGPDGAPPAGYVTQPSSATPCGASSPPATSPPATAAPARSVPSQSSTSGGSPPVTVAPADPPASTAHPTVSSEADGRSSTTTTPPRRRATASTTTLLVTSPHLNSRPANTQRLNRSGTATHPVERQDGSSAWSLWAWGLGSLVLIALLTTGALLVGARRCSNAGGES